MAHISKYFIVLYHFKNYITWNERISLLLQNVDLFFDYKKKVLW